jgi:hypothetical protein
VATRKPPLVIPQNKTIDLGGGARTTQEIFGVEIAKQGIHDIRFFMADLMQVETQHQIDLGNEPSLIMVDGKTDKLMEDIQVRAQVTFGTVLAKEAMDMVAREVERAIYTALLIDTGATLNPNNWHWLFKQKGKGAVVIGAASQLPSFSQGDSLIYYPFGVPHAGWANMMAKRAKGSRKKGFMAQASAAVRKSPIFKQFAVFALYTSKYSVPGNDYPHGTPIIVIRPRIRRSRV